MADTAKRLQAFVMVLHGFAFNFRAKGGSLPFGTEQRAVFA